MATAIDRIDSLNVFDKAIDDDDEGAEGDNVDDEVDASVPTSSLYASTMAALAGYDDPSGSVAVEAPYYIGREVDVLRAPIVTLRSVPDSPSIYAFTSRGAVRSWNDAGVIEHDAQLGACPTSSADLLNDDDLFVTGDATGSVAVWNEFGNQTASMTLTSTPVKLSRVVCRSAAVFTSGYDGYVRVLDLGKQVVQHAYSACACPIAHLQVVGETGHSVWTGAWDGRLRLIDLRQADCAMVLHTDEGGQSPVRSFLLADPNLFVAHGQASISMLDTRYPTRRDPVRRYTGHRDVVNQIMTINGRLYSASDDTQVRVFDVLTGEAQDKLCGHSFGILQMACNGKSLFTADAEGSLRKYDVGAIEANIAARQQKAAEEKRAVMEQWALKAAEEAAASKSTKKKGGKKGKKKKK